jgi:hypothetical protein
VKTQIVEAEGFDVVATAADVEPDAAYDPALATDDA